LASSQAVASSHSSNLLSLDVGGLAQNLWELALACDKAGAGFHASQL